MDIAALSSLLSSCLPFLIKLGGKAAESASSKIGTDAWETGKKLWEKIHPKLEAKADARIAAEQLAIKPESEARKAVFHEELETLLKENPDLSKEIAKILAEASPDIKSQLQINQSVSGNENQVIGQVTGGKVFGNVKGNVTISE
jgi:hypothetical protein